jgi:predicted O-methyltransferase YrrM
MAWPTTKELVWKLLRHTAGVGDVTCLRRLLSPRIGVGRQEINALIEEFLGSQELLDSLESYGRLHSRLPESLTGRDRLLAHVDLDGTGRGRALLLYAAVRLAKPNVVIETGCFTGWDSAMLLQALQNNGHGHLYTIDLPAEEGKFSQVGPNSSLASDLPIGFLVPPTFKERWTLIVGDVRVELPPLLEALPEINLFYHDSDHSYGHMSWELNSVWPHLAPGGLVVADDIAWNTAFWDFARRSGRSPVVHRKTPNVGALVK